MKKTATNLLISIVLSCWLIIPCASASTTALSGLFTLDVKDPAVLILEPLGGSEIDHNKPVTIRWTAEDDHFPANPITIQLIIQPGDHLHVLEENIANSGEKEVTIPQVTTSQALLRIIATDEFGNTGMAASRQYIRLTDGVTGIVEEITGSDHMMLVFPNPATDRIGIEFYNDGAHAVTLRLVNAAGKVVAARTIREGGLVNTGFATDNLPAGLYIVQLKKGQDLLTAKVLLR